MSRKLHNVECLRFVFAAGLVYYHLMHANLVSAAPDPAAFAGLAASCDWACLMVECFCVLSGWFLAGSAERSSGEPFLSIALDRFFRLWPVFALQTAIWALFFGMPVEMAIQHLLLLHGTGLCTGWGGILWFVPTFFWSNLLLLALLRLAGRRVAPFLLALVAFLGYAVNLGATGGGLGRGPVWGFLSLGLLRISAGISLGVLLAMASRAFAEAFPRRRPATPARRIATTLFLTIFELVGYALLFAWFFVGHAPFRNPMIVLALFSALLLSTAARAGLVSRALDRPVFDRLGRYAYSVYVMQQVAFLILAQTLWKATDAFAAHPMSFLALSTVLSAAIGVLAFHLVERPALRWWICWKNQRTRHP